MSRMKPRSVGAAPRESVTDDALLARSLPPAGLDASSFGIEGDEYVVLSFSLDESDCAPDLTGVLTAGERDIAARAWAGESNATMARSRGTTPQTVAKQLTSIYSKLGIRSRRELHALRFSQ